MKNRDGMPTQFQLRKITEGRQLLGIKIPTPKTYREAENALKRIKRALKTDPAKQPPKPTAKPQAKAKKTTPAKSSKKGRIVSEETVTVKIGANDIYKAVATELLCIIADLFAAVNTSFDSVLKDKADRIFFASRLLMPDEYAKAMKNKKSPSPKK